MHFAQRLAKCSVDWVQRSADPTPAEIATCVGSSLTFDPTCRRTAAHSALPWFDKLTTVMEAAAGSATTSPRTYPGSPSAGTREDGGKVRERGQWQPHLTGQRGGCHRPRSRIFGLVVAFELTWHREFHRRPRRGAPLPRLRIATRLHHRPHFLDASMERPSVSGAAGSYARPGERGLQPG
jgi:hypothetical protein